MFLHVSVIHSVHRGGEYLTRYPPSRHPPPLEQTPLGPGTSPQTRYTPSEQTPPQDQVPPRADTHPPRPGTPPRTRYTPPEQSMLGDTVNVRAVRILLECNLVSISFLTCTYDIFFFIFTCMHNCFVLYCICICLLSNLNLKVP